MTDPNDILLPCGGRVSLTAGGAEAARSDAVGLKAWTVTAPDAADPFVALGLEGDDVVATTWRGLSLRIALSNGAILSTTFVK